MGIRGESTEKVIKSIQMSTETVMFTLGNNHTCNGMSAVVMTGYGSV